MLAKQASGAKRQVNALAWVISPQPSFRYTLVREPSPDAKTIKVVKLKIPLDNDHIMCRLQYIVVLLRVDMILFLFVPTPIYNFRYFIVLHAPDV